MKVIVTGGAGFIGCNFTRHLLQHTTHQVLVIDKLTYAGSLRSLDDVAEHPGFEFRQLDIGDAEGLRNTFAQFQPDAVVHLAAESHVDRSIDAPAVFIETNIGGTFTLLQETRRYLAEVEDEKRELFRFVHCSTDEVYGSLEDDSPPFHESTRYEPRSPYSATKAAADHLVGAWQVTYGLPAIVTHSSNNYGPFQFPEKLIPVVITKALSGDAIPVFGSGRQVRDWIHVDDHCRGLTAALERGKLGEHYNIGANCERENLELVHDICTILDRLQPRSDGQSYSNQIQHVNDRPGHDHRYALNANKLADEFQWEPKISLAEGLETTVRWYIENSKWCQHMLERTTGTLIQNSFT